MLARYAATRDGLDDGFPFVRAEPRRGDTGVGDVEDGDGKRLEGWGGGDGEVDQLGHCTLARSNHLEYDIKGRRTRRLVRYMTPDLHCCEYDSLGVW